MRTAVRQKAERKNKDTLLSVNAVAIMMLAVGGVMQNMLSLSDGKLSTGGTVMMIVSLTLGGLIGEIININALVDKFGEWLKIKATAPVTIHLYRHLSAHPALSV